MLQCAVVSLLAPLCASTGHLSVHRCPGRWVSALTGALGVTLDEASIERMGLKNAETRQLSTATAWDCDHMR